MPLPVRKRGHLGTPSVTVAACRTGSPAPARAPNCDLPFPGGNRARRRLGNAAPPPVASLRSDGRSLWSSQRATSRMCASTAACSSAGNDCVALSKEAGITRSVTSCCNTDFAGSADRVRGPCRHSATLCRNGGFRARFDFAAVPDAAILFHLNVPRRSSSANWRFTTLVDSPVSRAQSSRFSRLPSRPTQ